MKKILFSLIVLLALVSCEKDKIDIDKGKLDPDATILIRPGKGVKTRALASGLTAQQIVENTINIKFQTQYFSNNFSEMPVSAGALSQTGSTFF